MANKQSKQALQRRAEKKHQRALAKKAQARRSALAGFPAGADGYGSFASTLPKLSAQIWDFAQPLLEEPFTRDLLKRAATVAIICWNAALAPDDKTLERVAPAIRDLADGDSHLESELFAMLEEMIARKRERFADDRRFIVDFSFTDTPDGVHLMVVSGQSRPNPDAPGQ